jgi:hypothetical protein
VHGLGSQWPFVAQRSPAAQEELVQDATHCVPGCPVLQVQEKEGVGPQTLPAPQAPSVVHSRGG